MRNDTQDRTSTLPERVEYILKRDRFTRDNDYYLWGELCTMFYPPPEYPVRSYREIATLLRALPTLDKVARARRKVYAKYDYKVGLPTNMWVANERGIPPAKWQWYNDNVNAEYEKREKARIDAACNVPVPFDDEGNIDQSYHASHDHD